MFRKILHKLQTRQKRQKIAPDDDSANHITAETKQESAQTHSATQDILPNSIPANPYLLLKEGNLIDETDGCNPLHHCRTIEEINQLREQYGEENVVLMARTGDHAAKLPVEYIFLIDEGLAQNTILPLMLSSSGCTPLSVRLDSVFYVNKFCSGTDNSHLENNITLACEVINRSRDAIIYSSTHPDFNQYSDNLKKEVIHKIGAIWAERENTGTVQAVIKHRVADCGELCALCADFLIQSGYTGRIETFGINMGSHHFIVLDRDPESNPADPETWGPSAVICDAWSGSTYPASLLYREALTLYQTADFREESDVCTVNIAAAFVPACHTLIFMADHTPELPSPNMHP